MTGILHNIFTACYQSTKTAIISSNTSNVNAAALFGTTQAGVTYQLTIDSGVWVYSTSTGTPALDLSSFAAGAIIQVINNGTIAGMGGAGGNGGDDSDDGNGLPYTQSAGGNGSAGGDAIKLGTNDVSVDNTNGNIFGGGGGGAGGGGALSLSNDKTPVFFSGGGGGGGGGRSFQNSSGGTGKAPAQGNNETHISGTGANGSAGTSSGGGSNGAGGFASPYATGGGGGLGGDWGSAGGNGSAGNPSAGSPGLAYWESTAGGSGGAAGKAVALNGKSITWLGGNNGTQVKGAVA